MSHPRPIAVEHLIALNDEIAALARAGMPLERGLIGVGGDLPGRLGAIATALGSRMERGATLPEALEAEGTAIPVTYRAVVEAGLRSGRLAEALEGLAGFARNYVELRRMIGLALIYPVIVLMIAYGLFVLFVVELIPRLNDAFASFRLPITGPLRGLESIGHSVKFWGPVLPALVFVGFLVWLGTGRASAFRPGRIGRGLRWVPWMKSILDGATAAQFADWLALLIEHGVPWPDALRLASEATGDPGLTKPAHELADAAMRGESIETGLSHTTGLPPLLGWLLVVGRSQDALVPALRHAAETYRRRAERKAAMLRVTLPTLMLLILGGSATLLYTMTLFVPWTGLLTRLSNLR